MAQMGCVQNVQENEEWPPQDADTLKKLNKGKICPMTANEANVATFAMG